MIDSYKNYKQIDDIIDERKKLGQYNVCKHPASINYRYAYSSAATPTTSDKFIRFDDTTMLVNEGDYLNNNADIKATDSEVTVMRVRCEGLSKRRPSRWDMHDIAVPGDGSHLGESPSMVNLATLVQQNDEYLVPLSSWDPYYSSKNDDECASADEDISCSSVSQFSQDSKNSANSRRPSLAGRISKFLRRHCRRSKTLPAPYQPHGDKSPKD